MTGFINRASTLKIEIQKMELATPTEDLVAALLACVPEAYAGTLEMIEAHGREDLAEKTWLLLKAELKRRRVNRHEDESVALYAATAVDEPPPR